MSVGSKEHLGELTLSLLVDDLLDGQETERCYDHMNQCKDCETAFENLQAISFAMAKLEDLPVPEDFVSEVMGKLPPQDVVDASKTIEIKEHRVKKNFFANLPLGQVACFGVAAMFGLTFLQNPPTMEDNMSGRGMDSATESATMTLGEGYEEDVMPSAMPMDVDGGDVRISGDVIMGEPAGMAGFAEMTTLTQEEEWLLERSSFALHWDYFNVAGSTLLPLVETHVMEPSGVPIDVVLFGEKKPDLELFSLGTEGMFTHLGQEIAYVAGVVPMEQWLEFRWMFQQEFSGLAEIVPFVEEIFFLFLY